MEAALAPPRAAALVERPTALSHTRLVAIVLVVAVLTRAVAFGNPVANVDDQFYLLVGDAMRHGAWPYIDIWDRKPPGLFLLFSGITALTNSSILGMQLIATGFAAATALVIRSIARDFVDDEPALIAALAYLFILPLFGGQTGQSPVFYNLFVAGSAWMLFAAARRDGPISAFALLAMLLSGLAMSIKHVAVAEGAAIGLGFLWLGWRRGMTLRRLTLLAGAMILAALLPWAVAFATYAARGGAALDALYYANFVSIFHKQSLGLDSKLAGLAFFAIYAAPLLVLAGVGIVRCWAVRDAPCRLLLAWLGAAFAGYALVPQFSEHYVLPVLVPLCVASAMAFARPAGRLFAGGLLIFCLLQGSILDLPGNRASARSFAALSERLDRTRQGGCLYLAEGPSWLYHSTGACRVTAYLFPAHLHFGAERQAIGIDPVAELRRVLSQRPALVVTPFARQANRNPSTEALLWGALSRDYRTVYVTPPGDPVGALRLWQRRDLAAIMPAGNPEY